MISVSPKREFAAKLQEEIHPCPEVDSSPVGPGLAPDQKLKNGSCLPVSARVLSRGRICAHE